MPVATFSSRRGSVEDLFFLINDITLVESTRKTEALGRATGIRNAEVLEDLVGHNFSAADVSALASVPLVEVAWADGEVQPSERDVLLNSMEDCGIQHDSKEFATVEHWLHHRPSDDVLAVWESYISGLCEQRSPDEREALESAVHAGANRMAVAHAGVLDRLVGDRTSKEERDMIAELDRPFHRAQRPDWLRSVLAHSLN